MKKLTLTLAILAIVTSAISAQNLKMKLNNEKDSKSALIEIKQDSLVSVYIDGKKYDSDILDIIDVDKIESINVLKGEKALKIYDSPRVIEITTKVKAIKKVKSIKITSADGVIEINEGEIKNPLIVIDGEIQSKTDFEALKSDDIKSVTILKDKSATALYGKAGEKGVIMIETYEWKKKTKKKDQ